MTSLANREKIKKISKDNSLWMKDKKHKTFRKKNSIVNIPLSPTAAAEFPSYSSKVNLETEEKIPRSDIKEIQG